jgi:hypothetical protein
MASLIQNIKEEVKNMMADNVPIEVINKTFEQLRDSSDCLKTYFDQLSGNMKQMS